MTHRKKTVAKTAPVSMHRRHHHGRHRPLLVKLLPQMFSSLMAPLLVGLTLQGFKGCDIPRP